MDDNWVHMRKGPVHSIRAEKRIINAAFPQVTGEYMYIKIFLKDRFLWFYHVLSFDVHC